jgi:hypothetical protein
MPPYVQSIRLRASTCAAFLAALASWVCLGVLGCSKGPVVVVSVSNIGPMTTELRVLTLVDAQPAASEIRVPHDGRERAEFGLRFPVHLGSATLSLGAYSSGGCLISTGTRTLLLENNHQDADLAMGEAAPEYAASCRQSTPTIRRITQSPSGRRLVIEGWGFLPGSRVQLDGKDATGLSFKSPERVEVDEPTTPNPTGRLRIELALTNPDKRSDKKPFDLLALVFEDAASHTYPFASGINPRAVGLGDFNGDARTDIAVAGAQGNEGFIALFLNQGQGVFSPRMPFQKLPSVASGIVVAELSEN